MNIAFKKLIHSAHGTPISEDDLKNMGMSEFERKQFREALVIIGHPSEKKL